MAAPPQPKKCVYCSKTFEKTSVLNRHVRNVHKNTDRKRIKHIKEGGKILCPICRKDFTHSASLKKHIIKNHESEDLEEVKIPTELVIGKVLKKQKLFELKTDLEQMIDHR